MTYSNLFAVGRPPAPCKPAYYHLHVHDNTHRASCYAQINRINKLKFRSSCDTQTPDQTPDQTQETGTELQSNTRCIHQERSMSVLYFVPVILYLHSW